MLKIAMGIGGVWIVGFVVIVAISLRKRARRKREATQRWKQHLEDY